MRNHKVAIQGGIASFHDIAARNYFGEDITIEECGTFKEVCQKIEQNIVDFGIIAIENKIAGSILLNYHWIDLFDLRIIGEVYLPLEMDLLAQPGKQLSDIKEVISHPMAIGQCQEFLASQSQIRVTEYKDTSTSAKFVSERQNGDLAVIGSSTLAKTFQLEIIQSNISDETNNYTRFYILTKHPDTDENANKASVSFSVNDELGTLADILTVFKENKLNLSKIQSVPVPNKPTEYAFHVDLSFEEKAPLENALQTIKQHTKRIKILGIYEGGQLTH